MKIFSIFFVVSLFFSQHLYAGTGEKIYVYNTTDHILYFDFLSLIGGARCHYRFDGPIPPHTNTEGEGCPEACFNEGYLTYYGNPHGNNAAVLEWYFVSPTEARALIGGTLGFETGAVCGTNRYVFAFEKEFTKAGVKEKNICVVVTKNSWEAEKLRTGDLYLNNDGNIVHKLYGDKPTAKVFCVPLNILKSGSK